LAETVKHFVSKGAMDIDGVGDKLVDRLLSLGLIRDVADMYSLRVEQLAGLERLGDKSAANIIGAIEASKRRPLSRVLFALGILYVGGENAELLVRRFGTLRALREAPAEEIGDTPGIGPVIARSVWEFFRDPRNLETVRRLEEAGVTVSAPPSAEGGGIGAADGPLSGKTLVLTGTLPTMSRQEAADRIVAAGGRVSSSVSAKTDYVVVGEEAGSKLDKARALGMALLDEEGLNELLAG
jgi:DNA ligase (NAD+)